MLQHRTLDGGNSIDIIGNKGYREGIQSTPAEMVFGTTIRLPNKFFSISKIQTDPLWFVTQLKSVMNCLLPVPTSIHKKKSFRSQIASIV